MSGNAYANFVPEIWGQKINMAIEKNCVMLQCVNRDWQGDADKGGNVINIITPGEVTASAYEGTISAYQTPDSVKSQLLLDQETYFAFSVPDVVQVQANVNIMDAYVEKAKAALELKLDTYLFSKASECADGNTLTTDLTSDNVYSKFVELAKILKLKGAFGLDSCLCASDGANGVSEGSKCVCSLKNSPWVVVHPDVEELLLNSPEFTSASALGDKLKRDGAIGKVAGLEVLVSNNVGKSEDGNYTVFAGTNEAITFASQIKRIESIRDKNSFSDLVRGLYVYGALAVNPSRMVKINATIA